MQCFYRPPFDKSTSAGLDGVFSVPTFMFNL